MIGEAALDGDIGQIVEALELGIAHHQPIVLIPKDEGLGHGFERVAQAHIGSRGPLGEDFLLRRIDGDADEMGRRVGRFVDEFGAGAQPDPMTFRVAHAERVVDGLGVRGGEHFRDLTEIAVMRVDEGIDFAKGEKARSAFMPSKSYIESDE